MSMKNIIFSLTLIVSSLSFAQPANDDPCGAIALTLSSSCTNIVGSNLNATPTTTSFAPSCGGYLGGDVWYSIIVPTSGEVTITTSSAGGITDTGIALYTGFCGNLSISELNCNDDTAPDSFSKITETGLTPATTIYIRVWEYNNDDFGDFNICAIDPNVTATVFNDEPCTATALFVGISCTNTIGTNSGATSSPSIPVVGCASYSGGDIWYSVTVPASGNLTFTTSDAGGFTDSGIATYSGTCGALTLLNCNDEGGLGSFSELTETGLTPGDIIFLRVWEANNDEFGDFNICAVEQNPANICGEAGTNVNTNDFCSTPATLTPGGGSFSATTAATFTIDKPGNIVTANVFCGSIENNSWYQFTAVSTTAEFDIISVSGCTSGIQAEVYDITYSAAGCCDAFVSMSNCYDPSNTTLGIVTANSLVVGQDYMLMVDGQSGANCDFTISGWSGINILPVQLLGLSGYAYEHENLLKWTTASELDNDYFIIQKSVNGEDYEKIGEVNGNGNSSSKIDYEFSDDKINNEIVYYRLIQIDYNGQSEKIGEIKMTRELNNVFAFPNPSSNELNFTFNSSSPHPYKIEMITIQGEIISESVIINHSKTIQSTIFPTLINGLYFVRVIDINGRVVETFKIVKG